MRSSSTILSQDSPDASGGLRTSRMRVRFSWAEDMQRMPYASRLWRRDSQRLGRREMESEDKTRQNAIVGNLLDR